MFVRECEKEMIITTEKALNKAAHTTTTVNSVLSAAKEMELDKTEERVGRGRRLVSSRGITARGGGEDTNY